MEDLLNIIRNDQWAGAEGTHNDLPLIVRFRPMLTKNLDLSAHPKLIQIYWNYSERPSGMPSAEESDQMRVFEDRLVDAIESDMSGVLTSVVTTNGYREWIIYVTSVEAFSEKLHHMPQEEEPYPIQIEADHDPEWSYFFQNIRPDET